MWRSSLGKKEVRGRGAVHSASMVPAPLGFVKVPPTDVHCATR
jgi:hypothetical protein